MVQNDHKPLEVIQQSPSMWHPQLQWMLLPMQKYDYTIQYKPVKEMVLANYLSHFPSPSNSLPIPIIQKVQHVQLSNAELDIIQGSMECNPVYSTIYHLTLRGWPKCREQGLPDCQTLLGSLGQTVHWCQPTPQGDKCLHSTRIAWLHPCRSAWSTSRDQQDASSGERGSILAWHRCIHNWLFHQCTICT